MAAELLRFYGGTVRDWKETSWVDACRHYSAIGRIKAKEAGVVLQSMGLDFGSDMLKTIEALRVQMPEIHVPKKAVVISEAEAAAKMAGMGIKVHMVPKAS